MYITAINSINIYQRQRQLCIRERKPLLKLQNDTFTRSNPVSFTSNTSAGNILKKLADITDPYTGVKMLRGSVMSKIEKKLDSCDTIVQTVKVLSKYTKYMQPTEKKMYRRFAKYAKLNPDKTIPDYLKSVYDDSITRLKLEEFIVLDDVDKISRDLSPQTALALRKKTTRCRTVILENKAEDTFKRKTLLSSLDEISPLKREEEIFERLKDRAIYLPTSGSSENAFVVKYVNRSHQEIAKRILRASVATIEHIEPDSLGGGNILSNFILASANMNSYRSNMSLAKFIARFPKVPRYCQTYIEEIIQAIHKGKLKCSETYPFEVAKTLKKQSEGKIILDLSSYKYTEKQAQNIMRKKSKKS